MFNSRSPRANTNSRARFTLTAFSQLHASLHCRARKASLGLCCAVCWLCEIIHMLIMYSSSVGCVLRFPCRLQPPFAHSRRNVFLFSFASASLWHESKKNISPPFHKCGRASKKRTGGSPAEQPLQLARPSRCTLPR